MCGLGVGVDDLKCILLVPSSLEKNIYTEKSEICTSVINPEENISIDMHWNKYRNLVNFRA